MIYSLYNRFRLLFVDSQNAETAIDQHSNLLKPLFWILLVAGAASFIVFLADVKMHQAGVKSLGTFGDFFGGVLNPIFTFLTFFGLIITIVIQRMELRLAREEYEKTVVALNTQAIETMFFNTLDLHHKIVDGLKFDPKIFPAATFPAEQRLHMGVQDSRQVYKGREVFAAILQEVHHCSSMGDLHRRYETIQKEHNHILGHYFRNLFQALKTVDSYPDASLSPEKKKKYAGILRAQLSSSELALLFLNCLDKMVDDGQFRNLLVRYRMLEHIPLKIKDDSYYLASQSIPIADNPTIQQYLEESRIPVENASKGHGAFGRNPTILASVKAQTAGT